MANKCVLLFCAMVENTREPGFHPCYPTLPLAWDALVSHDIRDKFFVYKEKGKSSTDDDPNLIILVSLSLQDRLPLSPSFLGIAARLARY
jgi:hypothetical protein